MAGAGAGVGVRRGAVAPIVRGALQIPKIKKNPKKSSAWRESLPRHARRYPLFLGGARLAHPGPGCRLHLQGLRRGGWPRPPPGRGIHGGRRRRAALHHGLASWVGRPPSRSRCEGQKTVNSRSEIGVRHPARSPLSRARRRTRSTATYLGRGARSAGVLLPGWSPGGRRRLRLPISPPEPPQPAQAASGGRPRTGGRRPPPPGARRAAKGAGNAQPGETKIEIGDKDKDQRQDRHT